MDVWTHQVAREGFMFNLCTGPMRPYEAQVPMRPYEAQVPMRPYEAQVPMRP